MYDLHREDANFLTLWIHIITITMDVSVNISALPRFFKKTTKVPNGTLGFNPKICLLKYFEILYTVYGLEVRFLKLLGMIEK